MAKRFSFEYKIAGLILVMFGLVTIVGIYAYRNISEVVTSISENSRPDLRLIKTKTLVNDLLEAENNVRSFNLTGDSTYLFQFRAAELTIPGKLDQLKVPSSPAVADSMTLDSLVAQQFAILNELIEINDKFQVADALGELEDKIERATDENENEGERERRRLFNFGRKKDKDEDGQNSRDEDQLSMDELGDEVRKIKRTDENIESSLKDQELALIANGELVTDRIRAILNDLEVTELQAISKQAEMAEKTMQETNRQIAGFCVVAGLLLLLMSVLIINYVRNNNRYRRALRTAKQEAEALAKAKQRFIATVSHEIRTPMNAIAGFTEQLAQSPLDQEQQEHLTMVRKSTGHLLFLINDVLDFTKLQAGKVELETVNFSMAQEVKDVVNFMQPLAAEKDLTIRLEMPADFPARLIGDPGRLRQVLLNLISNAVKFTEKGSVTVSVKATPTTEQHTDVQIQVTDTGIGMNEANLERVFEEFQQEEVSTSRKYGGTGLGLSIVQMLVSLHDGKVDLKSKPGQGTTVTLTLPYQIGEVANEKALPSTVDSSPHPLTAGMRILIVDDELYNRKLLQTILRKQEVHFTAATNGLEAIAALEKQDFDLILMDARMPELNGIEATKSIRQLPSSVKANVPIIVLTAAVTQKDREIYQNAGMNGFLAKPFTESDLLVEINKVMDSAPEAEDKHDTPPQNEVRENGKVDFSELRKVSGNDQAFYEDMLHTFLEGTRSGVAELKAASDKQDWLAVAESAHKMSAPCRHLSIDHLYQLLKQLEHNGRENENLDAMSALVDEVEQEAQTVCAEVEQELARPT